MVMFESIFPLIKLHSQKASFWAVMSVSQKWILGGGKKTDEESSLN